MITFFYGTDPWRLRHALQAFAATAHIDGTSATAHEELERLLKYPSFFGQVSSVAVSEPFAIPGLLELLKENDVCTMKDVHLLLVQRTQPKESADRKKLLAHLTRLATASTEFRQLTGDALSSWVREQCAEIGGAIERGAVEELIMRVGDDTWALASELEKLCAFTDGVITLAAVRMLVLRPPQQDDWELSNAIAARNKRGALAALYRRISAGTPEPLLIGSLASALRSLMMIRELLDRGLAAPAIASMTGLHPYVVSKTLRGARLYEPAALAAAHRSLASLDRATKEGRADGTDGLFGIIMAL